MSILKGMSVMSIIVASIFAVLLLVVILVNFATPEKRRERNVEHQFAASDPQFRREMSVLLGPALVSGNRVVDLQNGDAIFADMLQAIRAANQTICFETYIYWSGDIGKKFAEALCARAASGVKVNVLIDWLGSLKMEGALLAQMEGVGVVVHRYRPLRWYHLGRMNNRTHRKLLIVDGKVAFTGGVGIADLWSGNAQDDQHWRDMHFRIEGPVVAQCQAAFNDNWIKSTGRVLNGPQYFPALDVVGDKDAHLFISSPAGGSESMHLMYLMTIAAAAKTIDLQASYFVPDPLMIEALILASKRGVQIRIVVPGRHIDSDIVRSASRALWGDLLQAGVQLFEYQPTMMHNKLLIVDQEIVSVGSTNFDARSFRLNDEASLNVYDKGLALALTQVFDADLQKTVEQTYETWQKRPVTEKLKEKIAALVKSQL